MLQTPLCDLLGIDVPVILAPFGPWEEVELAAAVCEAGGLGSLGTAARTVPELRAQRAGLRERTDRPFAINHAGWISTMVLLPAVADVAGDIPVAAAGGIADGRGLAAALARVPRGRAWGPGSSPPRR